MLEIKEISEIIEDFSRQFTTGEVDRDFFSDFLIYNDLGLPLAQCVVYGLATPTTEGNAVILETWVNLCDLLGIDPNQYYEDFDDMIEESEEDEEE